MTLIILDRDGVINEDSDHYVKSPDEWIPISGSIEAIARLTQAGHWVAVATNQSGIARGYYSEATLNAMHEKMARLVINAGGAIHFIAYCPHGPDDHCDCRKPKPGLLHQIERALKVSAQDAWMVGDSFRDLQAGQTAGARVALVKTGKGERTLKAHANELMDTPTFSDLAHFVDCFIEGSIE